MNAQTFYESKPLIIDMIYIMSMTTTKLPSGEGAPKVIHDSSKPNIYVWVYAIAHSSKATRFSQSQ